MKPSAFTVLHNDVLEGRWRRSNGAWARNTECALSLRSLRGNSVASYLTLCDWNTSSTRLQRAVWWYLYLCLCQRNIGTERQNTVTVRFSTETRRVCVSARDCFLTRLWPYIYIYICVCFLQWRWFQSAFHSQSPKNYARLFGSVMASDAFHYLFTKVKCSQHVICSKWPCSKALLLALMEARRH